ncbi:MAG TPA: hypothetical protein DEP72_02130 [Clostridiales bacterium]|nr:MAG: hypothetical protein A2Y18_00320 [Clostridiales bacterium GWD2_32_19]HCC06954.1 hypothetical protein [Clostridiales bacterium]
MKFELRKNKYTVLYVSRDISSYFKISKHTKLKSEQITDVFSNLALLLKVDISLNKAIDMIAQKQKKEENVELLLNISRKVSTGISFHQVLKGYKILDELSLAILKVGEESGKLADSCDEVCKHYTERNDISRKLIGALIYPAITIAIGLIAIYEISVEVVPIVFDNMGEFIETNPVTDVLLALSKFFKTYTILPLVAGVGVLIMLIGYMRRNYKSKLDEIMMKTPYVGEYLKKIMTINFVKTYALLYNSGVNVVDIINICKGLSSNEVYKENIEQVLKGIKKGEAICENLSEEIYGSNIVNMFRVIETTGEVAKPLEKLSKHIEIELENTVKNLTQIVGPVATMIVAAIVSVMIIGIMMPMFSIYKNMS